MHDWGIYIDGLLMLYFIVYMPVELFLILCHFTYDLSVKHI